jgi:rhodanese-related sulfurtransferase
MDTQATPPTPQLDVVEAVAKLQEGALLLDVREISEWNAGHAPEAIHIPLGELASHLGRLDLAQDIVVICRSGRRSNDAAGALRSVGFDAYNFAGGMQAWQQAGRDVLTPSGDPGTVI